jgi:hypothetical protein
MDSRGTDAADRRTRELDREIDRYREAALAALGQLEWVEGYLRKIQRRDLATALGRNRKQISEDINA